MDQNSPLDEQDIRQKLGIPEDAKRVLIFSESSHWDPDWLFTAEEYFDRFVQHNLDQALEALLREPRRVYSMECMFFLRQYWEHRPEQQDTIRRLVNAGRLRLTSSGVTTADTLLPSTEAILRDLLIGQEWLRANGMQQEPKLAYFTDSFGCTPTLPSLLNAAGFDRTAITRIDGMYFMGCDLESSKRFPRPGSSAERLLVQERSLDFVWRDPNGAHLLCHWNAFTYGQGDMLAYAGISRVYLARLAVSQRSDRHVARRIEQFTAQLSPYSRTPYLFCPIGFDFVEPIPNLLALLDRYNQNHYPTTGIWAVNAGLDDYLSLAETYQEQLPILELDPNPYWTGFYTARPTLKQRSHKLVDNLLLAEKFACLPENIESGKTIRAELEQAWWTAATSNHHDFITGTSPDRVAEGEQIPWLDQALASVSSITKRLTSNLRAPKVTVSVPEPVTWNRQNGKISIDTAFYHLELDEESGGAIITLQVRGTSTALLTGVSNDLVSYRDSGGLWRMGYEFAGGIWKESVRASQHPVRIELYERENGLEVVNRIELDGQEFVRKMWFENESPVIRCRVEGKAAEGHSVVVRFLTSILFQTLTMDTSGGIIVRPPKRIYDPTFWPLHQFVHLRESADGRGLVLLQPLPGAVSCEPEGRVELVAMRNATREKAFGLINLPANPASGHERESYAFEYAFAFTEKGNWHDNNLPFLARGIAKSPWNTSSKPELDALVESIVTTDTPDVWVTAVKPASRGEGIIVRLNALAVPGSTVALSVHQLRITKVFLCNARERDLEPLEISNGTVRLRMPGTIATIRLVQ